MSLPGENVEFCPTRANLHWSQAQYAHVEFADFNNVQVAQYGEVKFFQPSDSEDENAPEVDAEGKFLSSIQQKCV
ncbi:hypothetical protein N657DRAFT_576144 [Parathielavia appendiculata]|uniref:Uncharacterized protein n=1 Tax=Parathielavia appendiculata TaxID=2587402 RepID=A0AAN6TX74_9PEZI|nr:hypothetical protein N657DRAFT_576144 [Parathielavia appendiculata]